MNPSGDKPRGRSDMTSDDKKYLREALVLARQGRGLASPNPMVGAVAVGSEGPSEGQVIGRGSYSYDGVQHAEVSALQQAGERARGGTLYVSLEPCSVEGRTPPCCDAILAAGIRVWWVQR